MITDQQVCRTDFYHETYRRLYSENPDRDFRDIAEEAIRLTRETVPPLDILIESEKNK
jgi:hypothetical protein